MLSAQRKEFDEKRKDESPYPRDFARWYSLDYFLRPSKLKSRRFYFTLCATIIALLFCIGSLLPALHSTHQAAPVSRAHAMFNQNCAACHDQTFHPVVRLFSSGEVASVSDRTCKECHDGAPHQTKQAHEAACVHCHREHQGHETLATHVADRHCTECHGDLPSHLKPGTATAFHGTITNFNRDHPEFRPSLKGKKDDARILFNHKAHLDLDLDDLRRANEKAGRNELKGLAGKMTCIDCHQMDAERKYLKPINYENHCARCHQLNVALVGAFAPALKSAAAEFSKTALPHKEPAVVHAVLRDRLIQFAQRNKVTATKAEPSGVPRPLPWKPSQAVSEEHWNWTTQQAKHAESLLFMNKQWQKTESLTACSHCHIEKERVDGMPVYFKTDIPSRWYKESVFNHGSHRLMSCTECHDRNVAQVKVADSKSTEDILLPTMQSCQECHRPSGGARHGCVECHRYHDRTQERSVDGLLKLQDVLNKQR